MCRCQPRFASAPFGRLRHSVSEVLPRHCHDHPFATLVLSGGYVEAGDEGRRRLAAGDVLLHRAFESHLDRFDARGAEVLILPVAGDVDALPIAARVDDPEAIVRLAERDLAAASRRLVRDLTPGDPVQRDWPDLLAEALRRLRPVSLSAWAAEMGLAPETVSRGFRLAYGVSPKGFRAASRARAAAAAVRGRPAPFAGIAADLGFADQAHMTRAVRDLTGATPSWWRGRPSSGFKTAELRAA